VEFASIFNSFGTQVTNNSRRCLALVPVEDEEISAELSRAFRKRTSKSSPTQWWRQSSRMPRACA